MDAQAQLSSFNKRLEQLNAACQIIKRCGVGEEVLIAYLCHKLKVSEKKAVQIITCWESFYSQMLNTWVADSIGNEKQNDK